MSAYTGPGGDPNRPLPSALGIIAFWVLVLGAAVFVGLAAVRF